MPSSAPSANSVRQIAGALRELGDEVHFTSAAMLW
jgi:hypothetical protein